MVVFVGTGWERGGVKKEAVPPGGGNPSHHAGEALQAGMSDSIWSVYIIRCGDGSLYTGIATDVNRRFSEHSEQGPKAAKYLRGRLPLELVYRKEIGNRSEASKEELRIKRLSVSGKVTLILSC